MVSSPSHANSDRPEEYLKIVSWNMENNGKGDLTRRQAGYELVRSLDADVVLRQEMWDAGSNGKELFYEAEEALGMRGVLGTRSCTAVFFDPSKFAIHRDWEAGLGPAWVQPPTAVTLRYRPAGSAAMPVIVVSYHLPYPSAQGRLEEAEWLTTWADKRWRTPDGRAVTLPMIAAGDNNSYPVPGTPGDPALPVLEAINDRPHRLHRSYIGPDGTRLMDTRPDAVLRSAGLEDVARVRATRGNDERAVARTVSACPSHGPDSRIDRAYMTPELLPALADVHVVEVDVDISDHHILCVTLDARVLAEALNGRPAPQTAP